MTTKFKGKEVAENYIKGLELTLGELKPKLNAQVDGLTTKQLRRALKATISYITTREDETDEGALKQVEKEFIGGMHAVVETSVQYAIHVIGEMQKQQNDSVEESAEKGDSNE